ncbi:hypothetical protein K2173_025738 [Erythroxylum novogranatense]|uniref:RING-type domain-containing protein n=1 Tax=Erythroxylum novogranatense TaxID=1862640 RepID=A0AAV8SBV8_9ROSI|nr:hypothetical protein K2173_025738 [Erythroxylum novogranatense]
MANQVVKVKRQTLMACMTCPLCDKLLRDATTISECLHTFCRKCIYTKISDEGLECCPICNIVLGSVPMEKLRPDHSMQDVRAKIFPFKRRKVEAPEVITPITPPVRRKERSLSSLVVSTPKVSTQTTTTGKRTKPFPRKSPASRGSNFSIEKEEDLIPSHPEKSSSAETIKKLNQNLRKNSSVAEASQHASNEKTENSDEQWDTKSDLWQPLNCLVEVANRTKSFKCNSQSSDVKLECSPGPDNDSHVRKIKLKGSKDNCKGENEKNNRATGSSEPAECKRLHRIRRKRAAVFGDSGISSQDASNTVSSKQERRFGPVWFSLVTSENQEGVAPLPQIPASYLRIKDGSIPVSFIHKYLMKKLNLNSEAEVEIKCMGQPVVPTLQLYNLIDMWLQKASISERVPASIGSTAKDFVMVLAYSRKVPDHPE